MTICAEPPRPISGLIAGAHKMYGVGRVDKGGIPFTDMMALCSFHHLAARWHAPSRGAPSPSEWIKKEGKKTWISINVQDAGAWVGESSAPLLLLAPFFLLPILRDYAFVMSNSKEEERPETNTNNISLSLPIVFYSIHIRNVWFVVNRNISLVVSLERKKYEYGRKAIFQCHYYSPLLLKSKTQVDL